MTRRDFILISGALKRYHASPLLIEGLADKLAGTNPKFDRQRFLRASGFYARPAAVSDADLDMRAGAVRQPPAVGDRYTGHNPDGTLMQFHAPFNVDNFRMTDFCEALHHEERDWERIEGLDLPPAESWREAKAREIRTARERAASGAYDTRSLPLTSRNNPASAFGAYGRTR